MTRRRHQPDVDAAAYVSGLMRSRRRRRFERHLLTCETCWREVRLDHEGRRLAGLGRDPAPPGMREAVSVAVKSGRAPSAAVAPTIPVLRSGRPERLGWKVPVVAAAISLLVIAGSLLWPGGTHEPMPISAALDAYERSVVSGNDHHMTPPDLTRLGLTPMGAEPMALGDMPVEAFAYRNPQGSRLTLFMAHLPFPKATEVGSVDSGSWRVQHDGMTLLSGATPTAYLVVSADAGLVDRLQGALSSGSVVLS